MAFDLAWGSRQASWRRKHQSSDVKDGIRQKEEGTNERILREASRPGRRDRECKGRGRARLLSPNRQGLVKLARGQAFSEGTGETWEGFELGKAGSGLCLGRPL